MELEALFVVLLWVVWPVVCYHLAKSKGRNTGLASVAGLLFGLFAVLYYLAVGPAQQPAQQK